MPTLHIDSVEEPLASDAYASVLAAHLVARSQFVGALPSLVGGQELGRPLLGAALAGLSAHGVARDAHLALASARTSEDFRRVLTAANEQMEHSPMPRGTWPVVLEVLGDDLLATLLGASAASMRRYKDGQRTTPGPIAHRLHFLALLLADLAGAYNEYGIRRWFVRPRQQLDGRSPLDVLGPSFDPYGPEASRVRALVDALQASGAA